MQISLTCPECKNVVIGITLQSDDAVRIALNTNQPVKLTHLECCGDIIAGPQTRKKLQQDMDRKEAFRKAGWCR